MVGEWWLYYNKWVVYIELTQLVTQAYKILSEAHTLHTHTYLLHNKRKLIIWRWLERCLQILFGVLDRVEFDLHLILWFSPGNGELSCHATNQFPSKLLSPSAVYTDSTRGRVSCSSTHSLLNHLLQNAPRHKKRSTTINEDSRVG